MNFREFVGAAEVHLRMAGWLMHGHNGVWRKYKKAGDAEAIPLPAAVLAEMRVDAVFAPTVERYLTARGWLRTSSGVSSGWPRFRQGGDSKTMDKALLDQMKYDRTNMGTYDPHTTPSGMRELLDVKVFHRASPLARR